MPTESFRIAVASVSPTTPLSVLLTMMERGNRGGEYLLPLNDGRGRRIGSTCNYRIERDRGVDALYCDAWIDVEMFEIPRGINVPICTIEVESEHEYPLLDHCNRHNAAELARCGNSAKCAMALRTPTWVPPRGILTCNYLEMRSDGSIKDHGTGSAILGEGDKISCGEPIEVSESTFNDSIRQTKDGYNVCRPFDDASAYAHEANREWCRVRWCADIVDEHEIPIAKRGELSLANRPSTTERFRAEIPKRLSAWIQFSDPPNHGHGAACGCGEWVSFIELDDIRFEGVPYGAAAPYPTAERRWNRVAIFEFDTLREHPRAKIASHDCPYCAGTGRIICDDERAGRVSPSHAAGGYAEWQRKNPPTPRRSLIDPNAVFGGIGADGIIVQTRR